LLIKDFTNSKIWQTMKECLIDPEKQMIQTTKFRLLIELY